MFSRSLKLRAPAALFAVLGLVALCVGAIALATWIGGGFLRLNAADARDLALPALVATAFAGVRLAPLLRGPMPFWVVLMRSAAPFAAVGLAWPLGFALAAGETTAFTDVIVPGLSGFVGGAVVGAIAGAATTALCCVRA